MKVCHVGTFWPTVSYGHTVYVDNLIRGMRTHQPDRHVVLAASPAEAKETEGWECIPCFNPANDYVDDIAGAVKTAKPDVTIIQHSPDLFGNDQRLPRLVQRLKELGAGPVVNSHSIYPQHWRSGARPGRNAAAFDRAVASHASLMAVHSRRMKQDLLDRGVAAELIEVLPHGSKPMSQCDPAESRAKLEIPVDAKVVLFFGFVWLGKGIDFLLDVFAQVSRQVPEAFLYVGGHTRSQVWASYMTYLKLRASLLGIRRRTRFWGGFVPEAMVPMVYSAGDVVALPYRQDYSSVSGVVHQTAGIGKLMLCSRIAKFDEVFESIDPAITVEPHDRDAWVQAMKRLLTDTAWQSEVAQKIRKFGEDTSWDNVGKMHLQAYRRMLDRS